MKRAILLLLLFTACAHIGSSPLPLVLVHGNGANARQWRHQVEYFSKSRPVIAVELRGKPDYSLDSFANDVEAAVNQAGFKRFALAGHSFGGAVVATYAARHPERVAGLVFADSAGNLSVTDAQAAAIETALRKDRDRVVRAWFAPILKPSNDDVRNEVFSSVAASDLDQFVGALIALRAAKMEQLIAAYPGPKLAIAATDVEQPVSFHRQFPQIPVVRIAGTGHWLMLDKPAEFNAALDQFLAGLKRE